MIRFWRKLNLHFSIQVMPEKEIDGVKVYRGEWMRGHGVALPPLGIIVGPDYDSELIRHEFGHFLQCRKRGILLFYLQVGIPSFFNLLFLKLEKGILGKNQFVPKHSQIRVEKEAVQLAKNYFKPK